MPPSLAFPRVGGSPNPPGESSGAPWRQRRPSPSLPSTNPPPSLKEAKDPRASLRDAGCAWLPGPRPQSSEPRRWSRSASEQPGAGRGSCRLPFPGGQAGAVCGWHGCLPTCGEAGVKAGEPPPPRRRLRPAHRRAGRRGGRRCPAQVPSRARGCAPRVAGKRRAGRLLSPAGSGAAVLPGEDPVWGALSVRAWRVGSSWESRPGREAGGKGSHAKGRPGQASS